MEVEIRGRDCSSPAGAEEVGPSLEEVMEVGPSLKEVMEGVGEDEKGTREGKVER